MHLVLFRPETCQVIHRHKVAIGILPKRLLDSFNSLGMVVQMENVSYRLMDLDTQLIVGGNVWEGYGRKKHMTMGGL